jgi:uncharacterized membrane protein
MTIKVIYTFLLGIFVAVFVGVGIAAFYPAPKFPERPYSYAEMTKEATPSAETIALSEKIYQQQQEYRVQTQKYNRNVSIASLIAAIIIVITSLTFFKTILVIADGLLLGGIITLLYSVVRGFQAEDNMFRFVVVSIGLFTSLILGYIKFIQPTKKSNI